MEIAALVSGKWWGPSILKLVTKYLFIVVYTKRKKNLHNKLQIFIN